MLSFPEFSSSINYSKFKTLFLALYIFALLLVHLGALETSTNEAIRSDVVLETSTATSSSSSSSSSPKTTTFKPVSELL